MPWERNWVWSDKKKKVKKAYYLLSVALDLKLVGAGTREWVTLIVPQPINAVLAHFDHRKKNLPDLRLVAFQARVIRL